ncbi:MAG: HlyD family efflux transporter periplasmic adaptor subunit [Hyphomicrobium sp.]|nr:HlyD family efflux transporter periplasmic adaptor subunit [Hyphomicrobium sp.]
MAVKIKRERPDQRRHHRVTAPLFVEYSGITARAADWSLGGLRVERFEGAVPATGTEIPLDLTLPFQGFDVRFKIEAEVVRTNPAEGMFAVRYTQIGERERELMQHFIEELIRGSMVDVEDTIQRIDVPVTPASLQPDLPKAQDGQVPVRRWPVKTVVMSGVYLALGTAVFTYASILFYSNFFKLEVESAVITAPVEAIVAHADGQVEIGALAPGQDIKSSDVILRVIDSTVEREIEIADLEVKERKAKLAYAKRRQAEELDRAKSYAAVEMKNIEQTRIEIESLMAQVKIAEENQGRLASLHSKGYTTDVKLNEAQTDVLKIRKELAIRQVELSARIDLASNNYGKRMFSGNETIGSADLIGSVKDLEAEVRLIEHEILLSQQRHISYLNQRERDAVRAPFDARVLEVRKPEGAQVKRGDVVAIIENRNRRHVTAWLKQDEVMRVGLGDEVQLFMPALGETLTGRISEIDRTTGFVREQEAQGIMAYEWRGQHDRSAMVTIAFDEPEKVRDEDKYRPGLPVIAVFDQRSTSPAISGLSGLLGL